MRSYIIINPILQMWKLKPVWTKWLAQGQAAGNNMETDNETLCLTLFS